MTALWIVLGVIALIAIATVVSYNRFVQQRNVVQESWRQIDVELTRRHDLIPNLVETVKGYAAHEREIFEEVARARSAAMTPGAGPAQQAAQEGVLGAALGRLFAVAEAYPQLQANQQFLALQQQLTETEDRIAAGRRFYNANVRSLNVRVESFPSAIIASIFHFEKAEYFEANDPEVRAVPTVDFGTSGPGAGSAPPAAPAPAPAPTTGPGAGAPPTP